MGSRKPKSCIPVREAASHSAPTNAYPSPRAKQNSGNDCRRVLMNLSRPSRATAEATMSHGHTNAPAARPSFRKKLAVELEPRLETVSTGRPIRSFEQGGRPVQPPGSNRGEPLPTGREEPPDQKCSAEKSGEKRRQKESARMRPQRRPSPAWMEGELALGEGGTPN